MSYFDEKKGIVLSEEDKQIFAECEAPRHLIFAWKGKAKDWRERMFREAETKKQNATERELINLEYLK